MLLRKRLDFGNHKVPSLYHLQGKGPVVTRAADTVLLCTVIMTAH